MEKLVCGWRFEEEFQEDPISQFYGVLETLEEVRVLEYVRVGIIEEIEDLIVLQEGGSPEDVSQFPTLMNFIDDFFLR